MISPRARTDIAGGDRSLRLLTFEVAPPKGWAPRRVTIGWVC